MYLLFDIGGTKIRIAISSDEQNLGQTLIIPTNLNFDQAMDEFKKASMQLTNGQKIKAAAGGVRALDLNKKSLLFRPRLPLWVGEPLHDRLEKILGAPVFLENDADMAGIGEATVGAGKGHKIVAYMTIGTGNGGSRIVNGKIDTNSMGFEPGYQIINDGKFLGDYISGRSLENKYGQKPEDIKDPQVWDEVAKNLALGLNNICVLWSPDIIVLGGSVSISIPLEKIETYLKQTLVAFPNPPKIVKSTLGDTNGLLGALEYLKDKI